VRGEWGSRQPAYRYLSRKTIRLLFAQGRCYILVNVRASRDLQDPQRRRPRLALHGYRKVRVAAQHLGLVPWRNGFSLALHKRRSFAHEQELRALVWLLVNLDTDTKVAPPEGVSVRVDLVQLIRKVYVSPSAGAWYVDVVTALLEKFGYAAMPVTQSRLYSLK
jgi:hypothetical protein